MTGEPECTKHNEQLSDLSDRFNERVKREDALFDKTFERMDEIKDCVGKIDTKVEKLDVSLNGKFERVGREVNGVKHECEERCTATEREVSVWRKINYFVIVVVLLGGIGSLVFFKLR